MYCVRQLINLAKFKNNLDSIWFNTFGYGLCNILQVMFGMPFGTEIDMWSLGCILAELYTGEPLFFGTDKEEILKQVPRVCFTFEINCVLKAG